MEKMLQDGHLQEGDNARDPGGVFVIIVVMVTCSYSRIRSWWYFPLGKGLGTVVQRAGFSLRCSSLSVI